MERVTGIGGIFFKARDPEKMSAWYREHLGLPVENNVAELISPAADPTNHTKRTVWSLFAADTDYFGSGPQPFMINYRVANLDKLLEQLRSQGVKIEGAENFDYGKFAWITDPEGNRLELWEPIETPKGDA